MPIGKKFIYQKPAKNTRKEVNFFMGHPVYIFFNICTFTQIDLAALPCMNDDIEKLFNHIQYQTVPSTCYVLVIYFPLKLS
jgi:hypothetical protein